MRSTPAHSDINTRLASLQNTVTQIIYKNISMGLFDVHKLLFSFLIAVQIEMQS